MNLFVFMEKLIFNLFVGLLNSQKIRPIKINWASFLCLLCNKKRSLQSVQIYNKLKRVFSEFYWFPPTAADLSRLNKMLKRKVFDKGLRFTPFPDGMR
jgi:hypothetical protein